MYYTYLIICIPTGQAYYGVSYRKDANPKKLWKTYFTSSNSVHKLIDLYGKENFYTEIRKIFDTQEAARNWEHKVLRRIKNLLDKDSIWLNKTDGISFFPLYGNNNPMTKDENKEKCKIGMKDSAIAKGYDSYSHFLSVNNPAKNKETAKKIGDWKKGKRWVNKNGISKMIDSFDIEEYLNNEWLLGKGKFSEESKEKMRNKISIYNIELNINTKIKKEELNDWLLLGWHKGRKCKSRNGT